MSEGTLITIVATLVSCLGYWLEQREGQRLAGLRERVAALEAATPGDVGERLARLEALVGDPAAQGNRPRAETP